jgi:hypothetical protein
LTTLRAEIDTQRAITATLRADLERLQRRRRRSRRALPLALVALLVLLAPLATLAASPFTDLNANSVHNANIDAIYNAGITRGCDPGVAYCPNGLVTREEMASFLARAAGLGTNPPVANAATAINATNAQTAQTAQTATSAINAQNAAQLGGQPPAYYQATDQPIANAVNATNAQQAQSAGNAAQLGGQPPSYYQPAGQPIASAINAQHATNAEQATVAQNATTIGGYAPDGLTRFASSRSLGDYRVPTTATVVASLTLTLPQRSFVLVQFTGYWFAQAGSGCPCAFQFHLRADYGSSAFMGYQHIADTAPVSGYTRTAAAGSYSFVASEGEHTYQLVIQQFGSASPNAGIAFPAMQAIMFPLDHLGAPPLVP